MTELLLIQTLMRLGGMVEIPELDIQVDMIAADGLVVQQLAALSR
jgi:hypothetical protein